MILKIIFLIMLCIPVGSVFLFLMIDTAKDIQKVKKKKLDDNLNGFHHRKTRKLRIAK